MQSLRSKIALVNQEPILFDMSIKDNILYGNPNANDQEIEDDDYDSDPMGFGDYDY